MNANFYLDSINLTNFVTFKSETISFKVGLNTIIGETGSGKSLLLEAIYLILGGRGDRRIIRKDADFTIIEATFFCHDLNIKKFFEEEGHPVENNELIIKRVIYRNGHNKQYINNHSCNLNLLTLFSSKYIDIVGQFENQRLLSSLYQLQLLDQFANLKEHLDVYKKKFSDFKKISENYKVLKDFQSEREKKLDFINYQINEINSLSPSESEENHLLKTKEKFQNAERIGRIGNQLNNIFEGEDGINGFIPLLGLLNSVAKKNSDLFEIYIPHILEVEDKIYFLKNSFKSLENHDISQDEFESTLEKLDQYQRIKRKYNGSIENVLQTLDELKKEQEKLLNVEENLNIIQQKIKEDEKDLFDLANILHEKRVQAASKLENELTLIIRSLNMKGATIKIEVSKNNELNEYGMSSCHFLAETNYGEGFFKIKDAASGGELSRILLAIRKILSSSDSINIFLFDEIDTGIGGETANLIGKTLKEVASKGQVIAITHLPQIAQFADSMLIVEKEIHKMNDEIRTNSFVKKVRGDQIKSEARSMIHLL